ncbi:hypothetical protein Pyn_35592 [Prunus yedoensis var. nudiflora]|uniref:Uncharacterized protein n=1 Tax=Prunus yedoensis var. nudiflora TaxID=2094558 RepID=A0A314ZGR4_PRUYE|nr:hypothetical protein Pyn_35592 [Prunus yedoensis var. nudiflora]
MVLADRIMEKNSLFCLLFPVSVDGAYHHYEPSPLEDHVALLDQVICMYRPDPRVGLVIGSLITDPITVAQISALEGH